MCGFAGMLGPDCAGERMRASLQRMMDSLRHRGPDDEGSWLHPSGTVAFGFRRLSIIDLSPQGHQPMSSASGRYTLVFNGEVYNHPQLAAELRTAGARFRGHSDTEVILAAFDAWGVDAAVQRFVGMFAMAVWDEARSRVRLIRDRLGIKPLYYGHAGGHLVFGSELKALVRAPDFDASCDGEATAAYLRYLYVPAPLTIYRACRKLPPGCILDAAPADPHAFDIRAYWSLPDVAARGRAIPFAGDDREAVDRLDQVLGDAVRLRMRADVPLGALLSGGIDSTTVVAMMQAAAPSPVRTFTIGFGGGEHDESAHAARVAAFLGTRHTELQVTEREALDVLPLMPGMFDEPFADPSQVPTYLVSRLAREHVTVALTGDGGDELFAGYNRYVHGLTWIRRAERVPGPLRRTAAAALRALPARTWDGMFRRAGALLRGGRNIRLPGEKVHKLAALMATEGFEARYDALHTTHPAWHRIMAVPFAGNGTLPREHGTTLLDPLDRMQLADQSVYLPDDLLAKVDRASMAVSLEARVPILDHRVVELAWTLDQRFRIRNGRSKWILREVLARYVPPTITDRPKVGFTAPVATWLRAQLRPWAEEALAAPALQRTGVLDAAGVQRLWRGFLRGRDEYALLLWAVIQLSTWFAARRTDCAAGRT
jgi:asparagine synthase (glutamine-hydrolysing)